MAQVALLEIVRSNSLMPSNIGTRIQEAIDFRFTDRKRSNDLGRSALAAAFEARGWPCDQGRVSHWANGERSPDLESMIHIAEITGFSIDYLCTGTGPRMRGSIEATLESMQAKLDQLTRSAPCESEPPTQTVTRRRR